MPKNPAAEVPATMAEVPKPEIRPARAENTSMGLAIADLGVLLLFLSLTFLLGVFPQHDTDFWWHLRTGDLIRAEGKLPISDWYTFGAKDHTWIDLHWGFQVLLSLLYQAGGTNATILAKCIVTTLAVGLLITARRNTWPIWVMTLAWLPALLVLGGRMYVRPETMTLLYLAIDLAVLFRIDRFPRLAWVLPVVQVCWVNTQGLFVFGPIVIGMALIDAALRRGAFSAARKKWWRTVLAASVATGVACILNPYGLMGALYPLTLAGTMTSPVFSNIGELQSIPDFISRAGLDNAMLQLHLLTMGLGALSFLLPLLWMVRVRISRSEPVETSKKAKKKKTKSTEEPLWRLSPFRLMLYLAFSLLSLKATRNSHQFAAVVGTVTAWNFGEWAAAMAKRRAERVTKRDASAGPLIPRLFTATVVAILILFVGSGGLYAWTKEERVVGWGEAPLWFAHDAVKFAGSEGMPSHFLTYHNGLAGLFEYHNGPKQKVFSDARLEVMGAQLYSEDRDLSQAISDQKNGWVQKIERLGPPTPGVVIDHVQPTSTNMAVPFLGSSAWRCVWYDATASVYLPQGVNPNAKVVDFVDRHFGKDHTSEPIGAAALTLEAKNLAMHSRTLIGKGTNIRRAEAMAALGAGYARKAISLDPAAFKAWRSLGVIETLAIKPSESESRFREPLDPIIDLPYFRATHDLAQALILAPNDFESLIYLFDLYASRGMYEAANAIGDRLIKQAETRERTMILAQLASRIGRARASVSKSPKTKWSNLAQLDGVIANLESEGRAETVADLMVSAFKPNERKWDRTDDIARLWMHLGRPDLARKVWLEAVDVPQALRDARVAMTHLVQGEFEAARILYRKAIEVDPKLFEAHYGLAILERDAGNAAAALAAANDAKKVAASETARKAAEEIIEFVGQAVPASPNPTIPTSGK